MHRTLALVALALAVSSCTVESKSAPPSASAPVAATPAAAIAPASSKPLVFRAQPGWIEQPPANNMRKAQYELPAADGDTDPATLIVFSFVGGGGTFEANVDRWASQITQADGSDTRKVMKVWDDSANGVLVRRFDASGHYRAESPPGSGNYVEKDGWRLVTLTVAGSDGVAQIRVLGPQKTVAHWMPSVEAFKTALVP